MIETLCSLSDGLAVRGVRVFASIPMVRLPSGEASGSRVATPPGVLCPASLSLLSLLLLLLLSLAFSGTADFGSPAARATLEHMPMVQQPVQHGGDGGAIAKQLSPVFYWPI